MKAKSAPAPLPVIPAPGGFSALGGIRAGTGTGTFASTASAAAIRSRKTAIAPPGGSRRSAGTVSPAGHPVPLARVELMG